MNSPVKINKARYNEWDLRQLRPIDVLLIHGLSDYFKSVTAELAKEPVAILGKDTDELLREENTILKRLKARLETVCALALLLPLLSGCVSKQVAAKPASPLVSLSPMTAVRALAVNQNCPTFVHTNNVTLWYTNCVLARVVTNMPNIAYGQLSFTAYWTTNNFLKIESGMGQPKDWIGPIFWPQHVWTLQCKSNLMDVWRDALAETNAQTYQMFSESDANTHSEFFRIKYQ